MEIVQVSSDVPMTRLGYVIKARECIAKARQVRNVDRNDGFYRLAADLWLDYAKAWLTLAGSVKS
jgi:hypothetical protein